MMKSSSPTTKIVTLRRAGMHARQAKLKGKTIVMISGCFDVLHIGHIEYFRFAKQHADILIVGIDNDANIRRNKGGHRPIFTVDQRLQVLAELNSIDYVFEIKDKISFNSDAADRMLKKILTTVHPHYYVCHQQADPALKRKTELCSALGIELLIDPSPKITSSSAIVEQLIQEA